eukprot:Clim_evm16s241 gene=Clim_evmTU16s241
MNLSTTAQRGFLESETQSFLTPRSQVRAMFSRKHVALNVKLLMLIVALTATIGTWSFTILQSSSLQHAHDCVSQDLNNNSVIPPKAAIVYLVKFNDQSTVANLRISLMLLERHLLAEHPYPVLLLHEEIYSSLAKEYVEELQSLVSSKLSLVTVALREPDGFDLGPVPETHMCHSYTYGIGYRHMCQFWFSGVFEVLAQYDYYMRMDTDSFLLSTFTYDPFRMMRGCRYLYGFAAYELEDYECNREGLGNHFAAWLDTNNLGVKDRELWSQIGTIVDGRPKWEKRVVYNNFELVSVPKFLDREYRSFVHSVFNNGGIYYKRWGDAPLRTLYVHARLDGEQILQISDLIYKHDLIYNLHTHYWYALALSIVIAAILFLVLHLQENQRRSAPAVKFVQTNMALLSFVLFCLSLGYAIYRFPSYFFALSGGIERPATYYRKS